MSGMVIKAGDARALSRGLYSLDLRDISRQAAEMITAAEARAAQIMDQARRQAESQRLAIQEAAKRGGYDEGLAQGTRAGHEQALAEARQQFAAAQASLLSSLTSLLEAFAAQRERLYLEARRDVVVLAIAIARRIVERLPEEDSAASEAAALACGQALELIRGASDVAIRLHPADRQAVEDLATGLAQALASSAHVRVQADEAVGRGGVIVETADCTVDATVATRVQRIAGELAAGWRERIKTLSLES